MAYEDVTYEVILDRILSRISESYPDLDIREGSIIYNAIAPAAMELAIAYDELDNVLQESFIGTASREYILLACKTMGLDTAQFDATFGTFQGEFDVQVPVGSRWNCDIYNYTVEEIIQYNETSQHYEYKLKCETAGSEPNAITGQLTAITDMPANLVYAEITKCLIEGEDEYTDDQIRETYYDYINNTASDGNVGQYKYWCSTYPGVGNYKIIPNWNGSGTVKVSILGVSNRTATSELVQSFQKYLDPYESETFDSGNGTKTYTLTNSNVSAIDLILVNGVKVSGTLSNGVVTLDTAPSANSTVEIRYNGGLGNGQAPIGAFVTVSTATEKAINITGTVSLEDGYSEIPSLVETLTDYFATLAYEKNTVSYMGVGAVLLSIPGISNVTNLKINNGTSDIALGVEEIPVVGTTTMTEVS